jgi:hypothetical protein
VNRLIERAQERKRILLENSLVLVVVKFMWWIWSINFGIDRETRTGVVQETILTPICQFVHSLNNRSCTDESDHEGLQHIRTRICQESVFPTTKEETHEEQTGMSPASETDMAATAADVSLRRATN